MTANLVLARRAAAFEANAIEPSAEQLRAAFRLTTAPIEAGGLGLGLLRGAMQI